MAFEDSMVIHADGELLAIVLCPRRKVLDVLRDNDTQATILTNLTVKEEEMGHERDEATHLVL